MKPDDWIFLGLILTHMGGCVLWGFGLGVNWCMSRKPVLFSDDKLFEVGGE